ncbi:MAG: hypothetical protein PVF49_05260 [Anaerolineales bacterium]
MILPLAVFVIVLLLIFLWILSERRSLGVRGSLLVALISVNAFMVLSMELLSLFDALRPFAMLGVWLLSAMGVGLAGYRSKRLQRGWELFKVSLQGLKLTDRIFLILLGAGSGALLLIVLASPPNNYDSLTYHMARVVHWAQNGSFDHYVAANEHQLYMPPLAEMAMLNLRLLWGNDQLAGLVQWTSMIGSLAAVSWIVKRMDFPMIYQWVAAAVAFSIPMGILQSTSTQNDYAVSFSVLCLAAIVTYSKTNQERDRIEIIFLGAATGLGLLTKGTFVVYAAPFLVWYFLPFPNKAEILRWIGGGLVLVGMVLLLNGGHWTRNLSTYGGILGSSENLSRYIRFVDSDTAEGADSDLGEVESIDSTPTEGTGLVGLLLEWRQKLASMLVWHMITPIDGITERWIDFVQSNPHWFPPQYIENIEWAAWNHEDTAGNPLHLFLVPISLIVLLIRRKKLEQGIAWPYALASLVTFPLLALVIANSPYLWSVRFQLPFFLLWAPMIGVAGGASFSNRGLVRFIPFVFLITSLPWLLLNNSRPLIGMPPWPTRIDSVLTASDLEVITAFDPNALDQYSALRARLSSQACSMVGLQIDSTDPEYLYWWLLDAPQNGTRVELVNPYQHLERYLDPDFQPCLILCTVCGGRQELLGLGRSWESGNIILYSQ